MKQVEKMEKVLDLETQHEDVLEEDKEDEKENKMEEEKEDFIAVASDVEEEKVAIVID